MQLGVLDHVRLHEDRGAGRVDARRQPIHDHFPRAGLDTVWIFVVRGERMPIRDEEEAVILVLQLDPVLEGPVQMAQMHTSGRSHTGDDPVCCSGNTTQAITP